MMTVKKFGVLSVGIMCGILSAALGLIFGLFYAVFLTLFLIVSGEMGYAFSGLDPSGIGLVWAACIIILPIFFGLVGFLSGLISAALYNVFSRWIGGIKVELQSDAGTGT